MSRLISIPAGLPEASAMASLPRAASSGESGTMSEEEEAGGAPPPLPASASWIDGSGMWE